MRAKLSYKSKRNIVIALIIMVLFAASVTTTYFFIKGNQDSSAAFTGNDSQTSENTPVQGSTEGEDNPEGNGEVVVPNVNDNNGENTTTTPEENQTTTRPTTQIGQNNPTGNGTVTTTQTTGAVPNEEYVTERIETEEVLVSENYAVAWAPLAINADTTTSGRSIVRPEITAVKTANRQEVKVGEELVYTITATNNGKEDGATIVKDTIPAGTTFVEGSIEVNGENSTYTAEDLANGITINVAKNGGASTVSFSVVINKENNNEVVKTVKNIATVGEEETEEVETKVANITTVKESIASEEVLHELDTIIYRLTSTNNGDGKGTVKVADQVPEGTTLVGSVALTGDDKEYTEKDLNNGIDVTLLPGEEKVITFTVKIEPFSAEKIEVKNEVATQDGTSVPGTTDEVEKEYKTVSVSKIFVDKDNTDEKRPSVVTVGLFVNENEEPINTVKLNANNNWKYTFEKLDKYNFDNEEENMYSVKEINIDEKYYKDTYSITTVGDNTTTVITNTLKYENVMTSVTAKKVWVDDNNKAEVRPTSVDFIISADKDVEMPEETRKTVTGEGNEWTVTFNNLHKYTAEGEEVTYIVDEVKVPNHYTKTSAGTAQNEYAVTNKIDYTTVKTSVTAKKVWEDDDNRAGKRVDVELKITANPEVEIPEVTKTLKVQDGNEWTVTFDNLHKYTAAGEEVTYTVDEVKVPTHYTKTSIGNASNEYTVTNTIDYTTIKTSVTAKKVWEDNENRAKVRPGSVDFIITADKDIEIPEATKTVTGNGNEWTVKFDNLHKYTANGEVVNYTVDEVNVPEHYTKTSIGTAENEYKVTNTIDYTTVTTEITAKKVWVDDNNKAGKRVDVELKITADKNIEIPTSIKTANQGNEWTVTFDNLHKYTANGEVVNYTVDEVNVPNHYTKTSTGTAENGYTVTNTIDYTTVEKSLTVRKEWQDDGNKAGVRASSVNFTIVADKNVEIKTPTKTANNENEWTVTFEKLHKYTANGEEVKYTINEPKIEHYTRLADKVEDGVTVVTNKIDYTTVKTSVTAKKVWEDDDNRAGKRVDVELKITADKEVEIPEATKTLKVQEGNEWTVTFENLHKYTANGEVVNYTVDEVNVPEHYTKTSIGTAENEYKVTNTIDYTTVTTEITAKKVWVDDNNKAGKRVDVELKITADKNIEIPTSIKTANQGNEWTVTFENLHKYTANGEEVTYTVDEVNVPEHYTKTSIGTAENEYKVTNTIDYTTVTTEITAKKVWVDDNNKAGKRVDVELKITANKEVEIPETTKTLKVQEGNEWTVTFDNLHKYTANGEEVTYTVDEEKVPNHYRKTSTGNASNGYTVTNTIDYTSIPTSVTAKKVWVDNGVRPTSVELTITADKDVEIQEATKRVTGEGNEWIVTFDNLHKYTATGEEVKYTVDEVNVPENYAKTSIGTAENGYTVTNKLLGLEVTKKVASLNSTKVDGAMVKEGDVVGYEITVTNTGKVDLDSVAVVDTMANGKAVYRDLACSDKIVNGLIDTITTLKAGETKTYTVYYKVAKDDVKDATETITNTVVASEKTYKLSDYDEASVTILAVPDVSIAKTQKVNGNAVAKNETETKVTPNDTIKYTITVKNTGNTALENVKVRDVMDIAGDARQVTSIKIGNTNITPDANGDLNIGNLAIGKEAVITAEYKVKEADMSATSKTITNKATVTTGDLNKEDTVTIPTEVWKSDITVTKSVSKTTVKPGEKIIYKLKAVNNGNKSDSVKVIDELPAGTELVGNVTVEGDNTKYTEQDLINGINVKLSAGQQKEITFTVIANVYTGNPVKNTAHYIAPGKDSDTNEVTTTVETSSTIIPTRAQEYTAVLVLDFSSSMTGDKIKDLRTAVKTFANSFLKDDNGKANSNKIIVIEYTKDVRPIREYTAKQLSNLEADIDQSVIGSGTNTQYALVKAKEITNNLPKETTSVILMSDGAPSYYHNPAESCRVPNANDPEYKEGVKPINSLKKAGYDETLAAAKAINTKLYTIGFKLDEENSVIGLAEDAKKLMKEMATDESYHQNVTTGEELNLAFANISDIIDAEPKSLNTTSGTLTITEGFTAGQDIQIYVGEYSKTKQPDDIFHWSDVTGTNAYVKYENGKIKFDLGTYMEAKGLEVDAKVTLRFVNP